MMNLRYNSWSSMLSELDVTNPVEFVAGIYSVIVSSRAVLLFPLIKLYHRVVLSPYTTP